MDIRGFIYAARMTNQLADEISEEHWDRTLVVGLGTLRKLFFHIVRIRDIYCKALVDFPEVILEVKESR